MWQDRTDFSIPHLQIFQPDSDHTHLHLFTICTQWFNLLLFFNFLFLSFRVHRIWKCIHKLLFFFVLSLVEHIPDLPSHHRGRRKNVFGSKSTPVRKGTSRPKNCTKLWWGQVFPQWSTGLSRCKSLPEYCAKWVFPGKKIRKHRQCLFCHISHPIVDSVTLLCKEVRPTHRHKSASSEVLY